MVNEQDSQNLSNNKHALLGEEWQSMVDCPVCMIVMCDPKSLPCGHCLCAKCAHGCTERRIITCPKCRERTSVPPRGLPFNYVLRDVITFCQQKTEKCKGTGSACVSCSEKSGPEKMWLCKTCTCICICSTCAHKDHRDHDTRQVSQILDNQNKLINDWKDEVQKDMVELKCDSLKDGFIEMGNIIQQITKDAQARMNAIAQGINADVSAFDASLNFVREELVCGENLTVDIKSKLHLKEEFLNDLKNRRRQAVATMANVRDLVNKFHWDLAQMTKARPSRKRNATTNL